MVVKGKLNLKRIWGGLPASTTPRPTPEMVFSGLRHKELGSLVYFLGMAYQRTRYGQLVRPHRKGAG